MQQRRPKIKSTICPRCGLRVPAGVPQCDDCGLIFERLEMASNKDAKRKIRRGDREYLIYTSKLPMDVKYWKLLLMVIFTGLAGGHCYYVGRYLRGAIFSVLLLLTILCVVFNSYIMTYFSAWMELIGALVIGPWGLWWLWDIFRVAIKKFKVPVAIDLQSQDIDEFIKEKK